MIHRVYIRNNMNVPFVVQDYDRLEGSHNNTNIFSCSSKKQVHFQKGEHCWLLPMSARSSIPALSLVNSNLLQDSVDIHRMYSDHGVYMLAEISWKHGHIPSHTYFSSLYLRNPVLLYVVQDQFQAQSTPRTAFHQEGEDDEDMTPMHMTIFDPWYGGVGGQQGCPSQEGGPRLIRFESPR